LTLHQFVHQQIEETGADQDNGEISSVWGGQTNSNHQEDPKRPVTEF
jgi:hypothetical protein